MPIALSPNPLPTASTAELKKSVERKLHAALPSSTFAKEGITVACDAETVTVSVVQIPRYSPEDRKAFLAYLKTFILTGMDSKDAIGAPTCEDSPTDTQAEIWNFTLKYAGHVAGSINTFILVVSEFITTRKNPLALKTFQLSDSTEGARDRIRFCTRLDLFIAEQDSGLSYRILESDPEPAVEISIPLNRPAPGVEPLINTDALRNRFVSQLGLDLTPRIEGEYLLLSGPLAAVLKNGPDVIIAAIEYAREVAHAITPPPPQ